MQRERDGEVFKFEKSFFFYNIVDFNGREIKVKRIVKFRGGGLLLYQEIVFLGFHRVVE